MTRRAQRRRPRKRRAYPVSLPSAEQQATNEGNADRMWGRFAAMTASLQQGGMTDMEICTGAVMLAVRKAVTTAGDEGANQVMQTLLGALLLGAPAEANAEGRSPLH